MTAPATVGCANTGCPRPAEEGERFCASCGLERALFRREARRPEPRRPGREPGREADRR
jgi:hypothetical protein